jgi:cytochrome c5
MRTSFIITCVLFLIACGAKKNISTSPAPTAASTFNESDVKRASTKFPGTTAEHLNTGKTLYEGNCGTCHKLMPVGDYTEEQWREINPKMVKKANKFKGANIDADAELAILKYVITMAKQ